MWKAEYSGVLGTSVDLEASADPEALGSALEPFALRTAAIWKS